MIYFSKERIQLYHISSLHSESFECYQMPLTDRHSSGRSHRSPPVTVMPEQTSTCIRPRVMKLYSPRTQWILGLRTGSLDGRKPELAT